MRAGRIKFGARLRSAAWMAAAICWSGRASGQSQRVDTIASTATSTAVVIHPKSVAIHYDNDVFARTDRYYSQGILVQVTHPALAHLNVGGLLAPLRQIGQTQTFIATLHHEVWTPSTIRADSILRGDRPYAGVALLRIKAEYNRPSTKWWFAREVTLGVIGPAALGREMQTRIHRATGDFLPLGWQYQVQNDVLLNASFLANRKLLTRRRFSLNAGALAQAGTMAVKATLGMNTSARVLGKGSRRGASLFLLAGAEGSAIGYDARLQGGVFNRRSPYVLQGHEISRAVGMAWTSVALQLRQVGVGFDYTWRTREFASGLSHAWGRVWVNYAL